MAIVQDTTSYSSATSTSLTYAHTCTGSNLILLVAVVAVTASDVITGVTYNGVSMTKIAGQLYGGVAYQYLYYLVAPSTGANNIIVSSSSSVLLQSQAVSYTGVVQSSPTITGNSVENSVTSIASTLTSTVDNSVHIAHFRVSDNATGWGVTNSVIAVGVGGGSTEGVWESNPLLISPAGSHTMTASATASQTFAQIGVIFAPFSGTAYSMVASVGAFTLSGIAVILTSTRSMVASVGAFTLTGVDTAFKLGKGIVAEVGSFILTGVATAFRFSGLTNQLKHPTILTNSQSKNSTTLIPRNKNI